MSEAASDDAPPPTHGPEPAPAPAPTPTPAPALAPPVLAPGRRQRRLRSRSLAAMLLEVGLIGLGVFLGLAGEQWRQARADRQQATEALRRFRTEIVANRAAVEAVEGYHAQKLKELTEYFAAPPEARAGMRVAFSGLRPARFEHTAWDLAIATQSLAHIEPELAFVVSPSTPSWRSRPGQRG